jgi:hypothetical protein
MSSRRVEMSGTGLRYRRTSAVVKPTTVPTRTAQLAVAADGAGPGLWYTTV